MILNCSCFTADVFIVIARLLELKCTNIFICRRIRRRQEGYNDEMCVLNHLNI